MLASTCSIRLPTLATVKFLSRLLTALNLLPSIATVARLNSFSRRQSSTNCPHTARIAAPLSLRKSAIVLKSGASRPTNHINSILRCASRSSRRLEVEVAVEINLQQRRGMIRRPARRRRLHPRKPQGAQVQVVDEDFDHPNRVLLTDIIFQAVR